SAGEPPAWPRAKRLPWPRSETAPWQAKVREPPPRKPLTPPRIACLTTVESRGPGLKLISLTKDYEVRDSSKKFGVTADELKKAVAAVGNEAAMVEAYLKKKS